MIDKYPRIANDDSQLTQFKNDVIAGEYGGSSVELAGNSLVIPEQEIPEPVPVATIDGVDYYYKASYADAFDSISADYHKKFILTKNGFIEQAGTNGLTILYGVPRGTVAVVLCYGYAGSNYPITLFLTGASSALNFSNVDENESEQNLVEGSLLLTSGYVDTENKILYYNLKPGSDVAKYVDSIKQGDAIIPLKDTRVPDSAVADAGKVVKVGSDAEFELGNLEGIAIKSTNEVAGKVLQSDGSGNASWGTASGTRLYKHNIEFQNYPTIITYTFDANGASITSSTPSYGSKGFTIISTESEQFTYAAQIQTYSDVKVKQFAGGGFGTNSYNIISVYPSGNSINLLALGSNPDLSTSMSFYIIQCAGSFTDTVTEI